MIRIFRWHSIGLIPNYSVIKICEDMPPYKPTYSVLEFGWLGFVLHVSLPFVVKKNVMTPIYGPLWSRRRKIWYRADRIMDEYGIVQDSTED